MLHGEIKVNDVAIAKWSAVRIDQDWYDCEVYYRNAKGYPMKAEFSLQHRASHGALHLASALIDRSQWLLKSAVLDDEEFPI